LSPGKVNVIDQSPVSTVDCRQQNIQAYRLQLIHLLQRIWVWTLH